MWPGAGPLPAPRRFPQRALTIRGPSTSLQHVTDASPHDALLAALDEIEVAARDNAARTKEIQGRARTLRAGIAKGTPVADLLAASSGPLSVELISRNLETLQDSGARLRYALARALREEGLTLQAIADLFGVTRQRISALIKQHEQRD